MQGMALGPKALMFIQWLSRNVICEQLEDLALPAKQQETPEEWTEKENPKAKKPAPDWGRLEQSAAF